MVGWFHILCLAVPNIQQEIHVYLITFIYQNPAWVPSHTGLLSQTARHFISLSTEHWQKEIPLAADLIYGLYEHITRTCVCVCRGYFFGEHHST